MRGARAFFGYRLVLRACAVLQLVRIRSVGTRRQCVVRANEAGLSSNRALFISEFCVGERQEWFKHAQLTPHFSLHIAVPVRGPFGREIPLADPARVDFRPCVQHHRYSRLPTYLRLPACLYGVRRRCPASC